MGSNAVVKNVGDPLIVKSIGQSNPLAKQMPANGYVYDKTLTFDPYSFDLSGTPGYLTVSGKNNMEYVTTASSLRIDANTSLVKNIDRVNIVDHAVPVQLKEYTLGNVSQGLNKKILLDSTSNSATVVTQNGSFLLTTNSISAELLFDSTNVLWEKFIGAPWFAQRNPDLTLPNGLTSVSSTSAWSGDGNTIAVCTADNTGVLIFVRNITNTFTLQTLVTPTGTTGAMNNMALALDHLGNTLVIGAPTNNSNNGYVFVWLRTGTNWAQIAGPISALTEAVYDHPGYGTSVAISADGLVMAFGGPNKVVPGFGIVRGALVYGFLDGGAYTEQAIIHNVGLMSDDYRFGSSITMNRSGSSIICGLPGIRNINDDVVGGFVEFIFAPGGSSYVMQPIYVGTNVGYNLGYNIKTNVQGNIMVSTCTNGTVCYLMTYVKTGDAWVFDSIVTPSWLPNDCYFTNSFDLSADGNTICISTTDTTNGTFGSYTRINNKWVETNKKHANEFYPSDNDAYFGNRISMNPNAREYIILVDTSTLTNKIALIR